MNIILCIKNELPILELAVKNPDELKEIPKDCFDRFRNYLIQEERYEDIPILNSQKHKVSERTLYTIISEKNGEKIYKDPNRIKTYEDACAELGVEPINEESFRQLGFEEYEIIGRKLEIITLALCEGWNADFSDTEQAKYIPWFKYDIVSGAFVFNASSYSSSTATAGDAARFCFPERKISDYAGEQFSELYTQYLMLKK